MIINKATESVIMPSFTNNIMMTDFMNCRCAYYDSDKKKNEDIKTLFAYERAQFSVVLYLRGLLFNELIDNKTDAAQAVLYMPTTDIPVSVSCEGAISPTESCIRNQINGKVRTKIGEFSDYTYQRIMATPYADNPVKQFYTKLEKVYDKICQMLDERNQSFDRNRIDTSILMQYKICDVLNVHNFELVKGVASTFEGAGLAVPDDDSDEYPLF